jgi:hypothetical protein
LEFELLKIFSNLKMCYYIENSGIFEELPIKSVYSQDRACSNKMLPQYPWDLQ